VFRSAAAAAGVVCAAAARNRPVSSSIRWAGAAIGMAACCASIASRLCIGDRFALRSTSTRCWFAITCSM
jgi:hypothetical protein